MRSGALEQLATPEQIFEEPATDYVAAFIDLLARGSPAIGVRKPVTPVTEVRRRRPA